MKQIVINKLDQNIYITNASYDKVYHDNTIRDRYIDIGVEYQFLQWSDAPWINDYYVDLNNHAHPFTEDMVTLIDTTVTDWVQDLGQEGNPNDEQKMDMIKRAIQLNLNVQARELGFDGINSIAKYMGFDNKYRADAESLARWTVSVWEYAEAELVKMQEGSRTVPTVDEAILELPAYNN